jgi:nucleotide-binding universal stress UspA family protein
MIKDILVNLTIDSPHDVSGDYALSVAAAFEAHLTGVAFAYEPVIPGTLFDTGAVASIIDARRAEARRLALTARDAFDKAARLASVRAEARVIDSGAAGAGDVFGRLARGYDLSIVAQARPDGNLAEDLIVEAALFDSGRPVLVVPYIQRTGLKLDRVMVCWDGSRSAARAIGDAMPVLERASAVDVVTIDSRERRNEIVGIDIAEHLARHGRKVELKPVVATDPDVAGTILSYAADNGTDLIVMGGYGHSRLREFVLGGTTRGILGAMTVPTFMAH